MDKELFIIRICLLPLRNPMNIDNLQLFTSLDSALNSIKQYMIEHKLTKSDNCEFNENNRYYVYENFMEEEFIWIERHII